MEPGQRDANHADVGCVDTIIGNNNLIVHQLLEEKATPYPVLLTLFRRTTVGHRELAQPNGEALKWRKSAGPAGHANACGATLPKAIRMSRTRLI